MRSCVLQCVCVLRTAKHFAMVLAEAEPAGVLRVHGCVLCAHMHTQAQRMHKHAWSVALCTVANYQCAESNETALLHSARPLL